MLNITESRLDRGLYWTGVIHLGLSILFLILLFIDERLVLGIPLWTKPLKFAISIMVYVFTLAYLVPYLHSSTLRNWISKGTVVALFVEMGLISFQAARGTLSHYNYEDVFGIVVYSIMGVFIAFASFLLIRLGLGLLRHRPTEWTRSYHQAVQMAIWITVFGSVIGGYMSSQKGHSVGGADGSAGLPFLNWSLELGDWRAPHFIGLHALQIFLILGWILRNRRSAYAWQGLGFLAYVALLVYTIILTWMGKPLI